MNRLLVAATGSRIQLRKLLLVRNFILVALKHACELDYASLTGSKEEVRKPLHESPFHDRTLALNLK